MSFCMFSSIFRMFICFEGSTNNISVFSVHFGSRAIFESMQIYKWNTFQPCVACARINRRFFCVAFAFHYETPLGGLKFKTKQNWVRNLINSKLLQLSTNKKVLPAVCLANFSSWMTSPNWKANKGHKSQLIWIFQMENWTTKGFTTAFEIFDFFARFFDFSQKDLFCYEFYMKKVLWQEHTI